MNTQAEPDFESGRVTRTVPVNAPLEITWSQLTDPAAIERWWGHPARFPDGMREETTGTFEWVGHGLMPIRILRFQEPTQFDFLWGELGDPAPGQDASLVAFTLVADGLDRTLVTVVESGFERLPEAERRAAMEENVHGWTMVLDSFVQYVESHQ